MTKRRYVLFRDQVKEFHKTGWKSKVIGVRGYIILVEAEVPEENENMSASWMEEPAHEPGEC
jgi:hypothetical protein